MWWISFFGLCCSYALSSLIHLAFGLCWPFAATNLIGFSSGTPDLCAQLERTIIPPKELHFVLDKVRTGCDWLTDNHPLRFSAWVFSVHMLVLIVYVCFHMFLYFSVCVRLTCFNLHTTAAHLSQSTPEPAQFKGPARCLPVCWRSSLVWSWKWSLDSCL